jgi:hypothetical protein
MTNTWTITAMAGDHRSALEREAAAHRLVVRLRRRRDLERELRLLDASLASDQTAPAAGAAPHRVHTKAGAGVR